MDIEKAFHDDLAGEGAGERGVLPGGKQSAREKCACKAGAKNGAEEFVGLGDVGDFAEAASVECGGAENEDGGVDEERKKEGDGGIDYGVTKGFAFFRFLLAEGAGLHDAGMEIQVVRHHSGAENADGDVQHFLVAQYFSVGDEASGGFAPDRVREENFIGEAEADAGDQGDHEGFDEAEAAALQGQNDEDVQRGEQNAEEQRDVEEEIEGHGGSQDFGEIAGGDGEFAADPEKNGHTARVVVAAGLGEIASGDDAEFRGECLQEHRKNVADQHDAEKRIAELGAAADVGGPVAGVHVTDGDEITGASEGEDFAEPVCVVGDGNAAMRFGERREREGAAPGGGFGLIGGEGRGGGESFGEDVGHRLC